ncbi:MAG: hypothetical protein K0Q95_2013 [Bacteroidota bacterium]|nr:hypothetical protein [Bacteroidota bacterium]
METGFNDGFIAGSSKLEMFDGRLKENGHSPEYIKNYTAGFIKGFNSVSLEKDKYSEEE